MGAARSRWYPRRRSDRRTSSRTQVTWCCPKRFYSSFYETGLASLLRQNGVEEVILTGQHTNICVRHTASDAFNNGFEISVPRDGTAMFRLPDHTDADYEAMQQEALDYLVNVYGAEITSVEAIVGSPIREAVTA